MSINRREEILSHIFSILSGLSGFETKFRNRGLLDNDALPAIGMLDGDETSKPIGTENRGRRRMSPGILILHPQVFIVAKNKKPGNALVGETLNGFRGTAIRAIASDEQLLALIGGNGSIIYDGCETDLKTGMEMEGQMQLNFSVSHAFDPYA